MPTRNEAPIGVATAPDASQMTVMLTFARSLDGLALKKDENFHF